MPVNKSQDEETINNKSMDFINKNGKDQIEDTEIQELGDMSKTHIPNFALDEKNEATKPPVIQEASVILDRGIDQIFEFFHKIECKVESVQNKVTDVIKNGYYKASIGAARVTTAIGTVALPVLIKTLRLTRKTARILARTKGVTAMARTLITISYKVESKEAIFSNNMANLVDRVDGYTNQMEDYISDKYHLTLMELERGLHYAEHHKGKVALYVGTGTASILAITLIIGSLTAYEYMYNGKTLGVVKEQEDVYRTIDAIGDKLSQEHHADVIIDKDEDISFQKVLLLGKELDDKDDVLNRLTYMKDMKAKGQAIFIGGKQVAILKSEKQAKDVLESIKNKYIDKSTRNQYEKIGFSEKVAIKEVDTQLGNIQNKTEVIDYLLTGEKEKKIHKVAQGETISEIAKIYGLKQKELLDSNPGMDPAKISIGQEISLTQPVSMLTVETEQVLTYIESVPFEIAYEDVSTKYEGENTVKAEGTTGERKVVARVVKSNGAEIKKTELSSAVLKKPISQVVLRGTKEMPALVGTGSFIYPVRGTITSRYGTRWGSFHPAIDIAARNGTPILASDGGKVIFAGYSGSYGYLVKIDHGGNRVTYYGHCSKLLVKVGDGVFQGMEIAKVGSTGNSTGPHVHFEVRINGETQNPLNYL